MVGRKQVLTSHIFYFFYLFYNPEYSSLLLVKCLLVFQNLLQKSSLSVLTNYFLDYYLILIILLFNKHIALICVRPCANYFINIHSFIYHRKTMKYLLFFILQTRKLRQRNNKYLLYHSQQLVNVEARFQTQAVWL